MKQTLRVRIDLMVFSGFEPSADDLPDASTICRFRSRLQGTPPLIECSQSPIRMCGLEGQWQHAFANEAKVLYG